MRRLISFVLAIALLGGGLYLLFLQLFVAGIIMGHFMEAGGFIAAIGAGWLWDDFIEPWLSGDDYPG